MKAQRGFSDGMYVAVLAGLIVLLVVVWIADAREWSAFKAAHNCKVVARIRGEAMPSVNSSGDIGIVMSSDKTGWLCDDGVTYYR